MRPEDCRGIDHLASRVGGAPVAGIVLCAGHEILAFGSKNRAMTIASLGEVSA